MPTRLLVCSNSGPTLSDSANRVSGGQPGGLVPYVVSLLTGLGGEWLYSQPSSEADGPPVQTGNITLRPIGISAAERDAHYRKFSIETLLWTFHYLHATDTSPAYGQDLVHHWNGYRQVNRKFAEHLGRIGAADENTTYLVNDYHFMLVPGELARRRERGKGTVVYVHHVPWCEPDYFNVLPGFIRSEILESLLTCDVLVFHTKRWSEAFVRCCERTLKDVSVGDGGLTYRDREVKVRAMQFPLDSQRVLAVASSEAAQRWKEHFTRRANGRRMIVRVDRLDLWKNHIRGYHAFEELLTRDRRQRDDVFFLSVATPVRHETARHRRYRAVCEQYVDRLNGPADSGLQSAELAFPDSSANGRARAIGALQSASTVLVNSTYDGFNLVSAEALLVNPDAQILLSENCGSYAYLAPAVSGLDPFDVGQTADLLANPVSRRGDRPERDRRQIRRLIEEYDAKDWLVTALSKEDGQCHGHR